MTSQGAQGEIREGSEDRGFCPRRVGVVALLYTEVVTDLKAPQTPYFWGSYKGSISSPSPSLQKVGEESWLKMPSFQPRLGLSGDQHTPHPRPQEPPRVLHGTGSPPQLRIYGACSPLHMSGN